MSFLAKNAFGLNISDTSVEALEIKKRFGKSAITSYGRLELAAGIIDNGRILDKARLAEALAGLAKIMKPSAPATKNVVVSIPESRTFIHIFKLPAVISEGNIAESIQYQADEVIPLTHEQYDFDYLPLEKGPEWQEVFYAAAFKDTVNEYHEVLRQVELNPIIFEPESTSLARALVRDDFFEGALIADFGARTTILSVYDHNGVRYSENIPIAGNMLTEQLAKTLGVANSAAESMKREAGLAKKDNVAAALEPVLVKLTKAINKAITSYQKQSHFVITKIIACGGTSLLPGLINYLQTALKVQVVLGDPLVGLEKNKKQFNAEESVLYSTVIGLALRGLDSDSLENGINFIASEKKTKQFKGEKKEKVKQKIEKIERAKAPKPEKRRLLTLYAIFIFLVLVFVGVFFWQRSRSDEVDYQNLQTNINSSVKSYSFTVYTKGEGAGNLPVGALVGRTITKTVNQSKEFPTSGTKAVSRTTSGQITIVNNSTKSQPLVATTRFLAPGGILFRLRTGVTVPAGSSVTAEIYADSPSDLPEVKPTRLTIPGLASSLQQQIYGDLRETIGGTSGEAKAVTDSDIMQADLALSKELTVLSATDFSSDLKEGEALITAPLTSALKQSNASKKAGEVADTFTLTRQFEVTVLVMKESDLENKTDAPPAKWRYTIGGYDQATGIVALGITAVN